MNEPLRYTADYVVGAIEGYLSADPTDFMLGCQVRNLFELRAEALETVQRPDDSSEGACPVAWCERHEADEDDPGAFTHVFEVGRVDMLAGPLVVTVEQAGGYDRDGIGDVDGPAVQLYWPAGLRGEELPADPVLLVQVARLLMAAADAVRRP